MACPMCRVPHHRLGRRNVLNALASAPRAFRRVVGRASRRRLGRRPARREWSATEVLGNLRDAELTLGFRIRKLAAEPGGPIEAYAALRAANVEQMRRLTPRQRAAAGRHPQYGRLRVTEMLAHWAEHDLNHLEQIRASLA